MNDQELKVLEGYPVLGPLPKNESAHANIGEPFSGNKEVAPFNTKINESENAFNYSKSDDIQVEDVKWPRTWKKVDPQTRLTYPYRINGVLLCFYKGDDGNQYTAKGSATLIGPQQIITAAHNIYSFVKSGNIWVRKGWAYACKFFPAVSDLQSPYYAPYGPYFGTKLFKNPAFQGLVYPGNDYNTWKADMQNDYAMIILNQNIGSHLGWAGINDPDDNMLLSSKQNIAAYPYDSGDPVPPELKGKLWDMYQDFNASVVSVQPNTYKHTMDIWTGMSGGGLWVNYSNGISLNGIQSYQDNGNYANRITTAKKQDYINWLQVQP